MRSTRGSRSRDESGDFSCGSPSNTLHCTLANLASGDTKSLTVTYNVDTTTEADASVSNAAYASADETTAPVDATDHVAIVKDVRLAVTKKGQVPRLLQLMYLAEGEVLRYAPDESDLLATERKVIALWQAIERARAAGDWRPRPSKLCDWCNHKALCPEFGGTPPPLPAADEA